MVSFKKGSRVRDIYRFFTVTVEEDDGWYFYSVIDPEKGEVIGGHRVADVGMGEFERFLKKQVDEYLLNPEQYDEDEHDVIGG